MQNIEVVKGDITKEKTDAIVNAANTTLLGGGGVDGAIHRAAGPMLLEACRTLGGCETGQAKITPGFDLPAKYVIHTPGPVWKGGRFGEEALLAASYANALNLADRYRCETVAFPSISTGVYRFPLAAASEIAVRTIGQFLKGARCVKTVRIVCFSDEVKAYYDRALKDYLAP
jgi:O-acetyl-ADP-ribose deacetylase (regulator of RNase III)